MGHISRFAEDLVIYSTAEFGFVALADAYRSAGPLLPCARTRAASHCQQRGGGVRGRCTSAGRSAAREAP